MSAMTDSLFSPVDNQERPANGETSRHKRRSLIADVERELREHRIPCVAVDEAKKALFNQTKLKSFHFVVYAREDANWLLWCGEPTAAVRQEMTQWAQIFGEDYQVVYAVRRKGGIAYRAPSGARLTLHGDTPSQNPPPSAHGSAVS